MGFSIGSGFWLQLGYDSLDDPGRRLVHLSGAQSKRDFSAVEPRYVGAVSGISLTSANIANAMGVAIGSVLFLRWLNYHGLDQSGVPPYTQWGENPAVFIRAFQNSWLIIAGLTVIAIVASSMRGVDTGRRKILSRHPQQPRNGQKAEVETVESKNLL